MPDDDQDATVGDDDEASGDEAPSRKSRSSVVTPSPKPANDPELREQLRTLDPRERRYALILVALGLIVSVLSLRVYDTSLETKKPRDGSCSFFHGSSHIGKSCQLLISTHPADYHLLFALGIVLCGVLFLAAWRSMRTLVIFTSAFFGLFAGLFASILGLLFLFFAGWLVWRSWQLQRHGTKDAKEVRKLAQARSAERAAQRKERRSTKGQDEPSGRPQIQASKRYTPKSKAKRR